MDSPSLHPQSQIYTICITGGPCSGKDTAIIKLNSHLQSKGFKVFMVPDTVQLTNKSGGDICNQQMSQDKKCEFYALMLDNQINLENYFTQIAQLNDKPSVILFNKGVMDVKAKMDETSWQSLLDIKSYNNVYLRDQRYDVIIHMVTTAAGAIDQFYKDIDEQLRPYSIEEALKIDKHIQNAWNGHPHHLQIDNSEKGIDVKVERVFRGVEKFIGISTNNQLYRKFLIKDFEEQMQQEINKGLQKILVEEIYLNDDEEQNLEYQYIRKRGCLGAYTYSLTKRFKVDKKENRQVIKRNISAGQYISLFRKRDLSMKILKKIKYTFVHNKQSFVLEKFKDSKDKNISIMKIDAVDVDLIQSDKNNSSNSDKNIPNLPSWVQVIKEITDNSKYSGKYLGKK